MRWVAAVMYTLNDIENRTIIIMCVSVWNSARIYMGETAALNSATSAVQEYTPKTGTLVCSIIHAIPNDRTKTIFQTYPTVVSFN